MKIEKEKPHLEKSSELKVDENENFCFSLEQHDRNQGQSFAEWEKDGLLSKAMEVLISLGNEVKVMRQPSLTLLWFGRESSLSIPNHSNVSEAKQ